MKAGFFTAVVTCLSVDSSLGFVGPSYHRVSSRQSSSLASSSTTETARDLKELYPQLAVPLTELGFSTPTPIQAATSSAGKEDNLLLIAPTGSGKTLAYLLPALTKAISEDGTILMVAPTRELAVQLQRDVMSLLDHMDLTEEAAVLSIRGVAWPTTPELNRALLLIGTDEELLSAMTNVQTDFLTSLTTVVLDEIDVLLPPPPKTMRTSLDRKKGDDKQKRNTAQDDRRRQEQKRKQMTAKRNGVITGSNNMVVTPTEQLLTMVALATRRRLLVLAGSATASRKTLDRLNSALRSSANEAGGSFEQLWGKSAKPCRPAVDDESDANDSDGATSHTIRSVTCPEEVKHQFVAVTKEQAVSSGAVLACVAKANITLKPKKALVFICGEFKKATTKAAAVVRAAPRGATSQARRNSAYRQTKLAKKATQKAKPTSSTESLSARKACTTLDKFGIDATPLHVALGLEGKDDGEQVSPFLVTFEGSARGLHFDDVDVVFVVGRPSSAASYLHLAGRVGRAAPAEDGSVVVRPGTVVSVCTKGSATELEKWTKQIGGNALEELVL